MLKLEKLYKHMPLKTDPSKKKTVGIIGSGVTGLAASTVLDNNGCKVILLERDKHIGGHCYTKSYIDPPQINQLMLI